MDTTQTQNRATDPSLAVSHALQWLAATSVVFVGVYTACNQLTHLRRDVALAVFEWERSIPVLPWTLVPYLSIFLLFVLSFVIDRRRKDLTRHVIALAFNLLIAALCYALVPLRFAFERPVLEGAWGLAFQLLHWADLPYNRAPSLHISVLLLLWVRLSRQLLGWSKAALAAWFVLVGVSVLTTHQHHVVDIPSGLAAGLLSLALARWALRHAPAAFAVGALNHRSQARSCAR
jgi:hypothetical protein